MADYGFVHDGKVYTPNQTTSIATQANADRNKAIEQQELARWRTCPDRQLAYYKLPDDVTPTWAGERTITARSLTDASVTTWLGTPLGRIVQLRFYRHNFGGRFVSIRIIGTNGAEYHGRASYDWGGCVWLRKCKR